MPKGTTMSATLFFDRLLCAIGLRTLNQQFLFSYALMFLLALVASEILARRAFPQRTRR